MKNDFREKMRASLTKWDSPNGERLLEAFSVAEKHGLMKMFLNDLLLDSEFEKFAMRIEVMHQIFMDTPYRQITSMTGLSSSIIARISKRTINKDCGFREVMRKIYPRGYRYFD